MATRLHKLSQIPPNSLIPTANWELSAIAISLMENGQFAEPFILPTGHSPPETINRVNRDRVNKINRPPGLSQKKDEVGWQRRHYTLVELITG